MSRCELLYLSNKTFSYVLFVAQINRALEANFLKELYNSKTHGFLKK